MNRKLIALMLVMLLILMVGCKSKDNGDATLPTEVTEATEPTVAATETLPPALTTNPFGNDEESADETQSEETEAPSATEDNEQPTEAPKDTEPPKATEAPTEPDSKPTEAPEDDGEMNYEKYMSLSAAEQSEYMNSFESVDAFFEWYNAAKEEHAANNNDIEVGDGSFDLGELEGNG